MVTCCMATERGDVLRERPRNDVKGGGGNQKWFEEHMAHTKRGGGELVCELF
jgi:hypothetical protein